MMFRADVEFKCKPFWSNDVNKIAAEVYPKDSKKSILKVILIEKIVIETICSGQERLFSYHFLLEFLTFNILLHAKVVPKVIGN